MDNYRHNWYIHDSMQFARELFFADMKAAPDEQLLAAYVNAGVIPFMYLQEGNKHQARVNSNYLKNKLPDGI